MTLADWTVQMNKLIYRTREQWKIINLDHEEEKKTEKKEIWVPQNKG